MWESIGVTVLGGVVSRIVNRELVKHNLIKDTPDASASVSTDIKNLAYSYADYALKEIESAASDPTKILALCAAARTKLKSLLGQ